MTLATTMQFSKCPEKLSDAQVKQFRRDGYLAFTDVLSQKQVADAKEEITAIVHRLVDDHRESERTDALLSPHCRTFLQIEPGKNVYDYSPEDVELNIRKLMSYCSGSAFFNAMACEYSRIQNILSALIGEAPMLFQDMALVKPPYIGSEKPWHQDNAYFSVLPLDSVVGVWIALDDATVENGCMHVRTGGHDLARCHYHDRDCEIHPSRLREQEHVEAIELPAGGALFFAGMLPHQTPPNRSSVRRRALQFHYRSRDSRIADEDEYNQVFCERDGTPASCRVQDKAKLK